MNDETKKDALSVSVPAVWQQHRQKIAELLLQTDQEILQLKGRLYDLERRKQELQQHLKLCVAPMTCAAHPEAKPESAFEWSRDGRFVKCKLD